MIRAGTLRHRVDIQAVTNTPNENGGNVQTWDTVKTRWASVEAMTGRELFTAQQVKADVTHKITLYYYEGLSPHMRFLFDSRVFHPAYVINPDNKRIMHECLCKEVV